MMTKAWTINHLCAFQLVPHMIASSHNQHLDNRVQRKYLKIFPVFTWPKYLQFSPWPDHLGESLDLTTWVRSRLPPGKCQNIWISHLGFSKEVRATCMGVSAVFQVCKLSHRHLKILKNTLPEEHIELKETLLYIYLISWNLLAVDSRILAGQFGSAVLITPGQDHHWLWYLPSK